MRNWQFVLAAMLASAMLVACGQQESVVAGEPVYGLERAKLTDLLYRYSYAYDDKDVDAMSDTLTEDHESIAYLNGSETPAVVFHTRRDLLDWMANRVGIMEKYKSASHDLNLMPIFTWIDENTVHIKSTGLNFFRSGWNVPRATQGGLIDSVAVRDEDDKWRFSKRTVHLWGHFNVNEIGETLQSGSDFRLQAEGEEIKTQ